MFEGTHVVAKFFISKAPNGEVNCISRTLGKFSIIDNNFKGEVKDGELWLCKIVKEIRPSKNTGTFILLPVKKTDPLQLRKLIPGFYTAKEAEDGAMVLTPDNNPSDYWILSAATRQIFAKKHYAVIVPIKVDEHETCNSYTL